MRNRLLISLVVVLCGASFQGQEIVPEQKARVDQAVPRQAPAKFYSGLGHGPEVFSNPQMLRHLLAGIQYALGDLAADDAPDSAGAR